MHYHVKNVSKYKNNIKKKIIHTFFGIVSVATVLLSLSPYYVRDYEGEDITDYIKDYISQETNIGKDYYKGEVINGFLIKKGSTGNKSEPEENPIINTNKVEKESAIKTDDEVDNNSFYELSNEEKIAEILVMHNITEFEFFQLVSTVAHEAGANYYSECYDVITTLFNRTLSEKWCWSCEHFGGTDGTNIINQLKLSGQFAGFLPNEAGYDKDKFINTAAYQATIDFLYSLERSHNYLCFNAPWYEYCPNYAIQLNPDTKGNKYFDLLEENDLNEKANDLGVKLAISR